MRYEELVNESARWVDEGLITSEQADAIRARYRAEQPVERRGRLAQVVGIVGAVALGLGVILFFAANWDEMARGVRLGLLLVALLGAYLGGFYLAEIRREHEGVGKALILVGTILFGASLFLVGQMYHVQAHDPLALLLWALAAAAVATVVRFAPVAALSIGVFGAWIAFELASANDDAALGTPVLAVVYGSALYGIGTGARRWLDPLRFTGSMRGFGIALVAGGVFVLTFRGIYDEFDGTDEALSSGTVQAAIVLLAIAAAGGCIALVLAPDRGATRPWEAAVLAASSILAMLAILVPEHIDRTGEFVGGAVVYPLLFNVLMVAIAVGAIVVGYLNDEVWLVNAGIAFVAVDVVARYFDFFWDLMPRSLVFIGFGLLLLGLAFGLERQRSRLVERIRTG